MVGRRFIRVVRGVRGVRGALEVFGCRELLRLSRRRFIRVVRGVRGVRGALGVFPFSALVSRLSSLVSRLKKLSIVNSSIVNLFFLRPQNTAQSKEGAIPLLALNSPY